MKSFSALVPLDHAVLLLILALALAVAFLSSSRNEKHVKLRHTLVSLMPQPQKMLLEIAGFGVVGLIVIANLPLRTGDLLEGTVLRDSGKAAIAAAHHDYHFWPILFHPDSLFGLQRLLHSLGAVLLMARGGCAYSSGMLFLALTLLSIGSGLLVVLWGWYEDYVPEGPLGGNFAICSATLSFGLMLTAAWRALRSARASGSSLWVMTASLCALVSLSVWLGRMHHLDMNRNSSGMLFTVVAAMEMCAMPLLALAFLRASLQGACMFGMLIAVTAAQGNAALWFADFCGVFHWTNGMSRPELFRAEMEKLALKRYVMHHQATVGSPYTLLIVCHAVQLASLALAFVGYATCLSCRCICRRSTAVCCYEV